MSEEQRKQIVDMIIARLERFESRVEKRFDDHEKKLDNLTAWKSKIAGGGVILIGVGSYLANIILK